MFEIEKQIIANRELEVNYCKAREGQCGDDIETGRKECPFLKQFEGCTLTFNMVKPCWWPRDTAESLIEARERWKAEYYKED